MGFTLQGWDGAGGGMGYALAFWLVEKAYNLWGAIRAGWSPIFIVSDE